MANLDKSIGVAIEAELLERIDAQIHHLSSEWRKATRSEAVRRVLLAGLAVVERGEAPKGGAVPEARELSKLLGAKVDAELLARIDAQIPRISSAWRKASRSEAARMVLLTGVEALEKAQGEAPVKAKPPKPKVKARKGGA